MLHFVMKRQATRCMAARFYNKQVNKRQKHKNFDPRRNVQYPYVKGDAIHEDAISNNSSSLFKYKEKNTKADYKKMETLKQRINVLEAVQGLKYESLSEGDLRLGRTILAAKSNHPNVISDTILLEGQRLISDSLLMGVHAKTLYFCDTEILKELPSHLLNDVDLYKISHRDMKVWSDTVTPAGILGVFQKPQEGKALLPAEHTLPITLIFDSLKDPGNVGTLIRTAAAVGCQRVIAIKGTANIWDSKVLRSAMGGHFTVSIYSGLSWGEVSNYLEDGTRVFLANTWQSSQLVNSFNARLQREDLDRALEESENTDDSDIDEGTLLKKDKNTNLLFNDKPTSYGSNAQVFQDVPLAVYDYSNIVINQSSSDNENQISVALVVGGEIEGLSSEAKRFAYEHYGHYVSIPMQQTVNSLNTAIAGSIILYELRKLF